MTTLSKDEIIAWALEMNVLVRYGTMHFDLDELTKFATLCRADLVAEIKVLEKELGNTVSMARANDLVAENERLASLAKEYRDNGDRLLDVTNSLKAELSALRAEYVPCYSKSIADMITLRAGSGEAVKFDVATLISDAHFVFNNPPAECPQDVRDVIEWFAASLDTVHATPQPSAVPVVRELVGVLREFIDATEGVILQGGIVTIDCTSSGWFDRARVSTEASQQWLKECGE